jgi:hypothetical protein
MAAPDQILVGLAFKHFRLGENALAALLPQH